MASLIITFPCGSLILYNFWSRKTVMKIIFIQFLSCPAWSFSLIKEISYSYSYSYWYCYYKHIVPSTDFFVFLVSVHVVVDVQASVESFICGDCSYSVSLALFVSEVFKTSSIFWFFTFLPLLTVTSNFAILVSSTVLSSFLCHAKCTSLLCPKWLVIQVNSALVMSSSCSMVARYVLVLVGVIRCGFSKLAICFVIPCKVSHPFK